MKSNSAPPPLQLSVVVPTFGRAERVRKLLERIDRQTLAPETFEVILVDDGSPVPIDVSDVARPYSLRVLRQENAGPAAARNRGVAQARAPLVLFLNDDALPAADVFAKHVDAHRQQPGRVAVLGSFEFAAHLRERPFVQVLSDSDLLFNFPGLRDGRFHDWTFFWTCNISLPKAALDAVGGFDSVNFREAIVEDVELGYRLQAAGYRVQYRADIVCEHDHDLDSASYFRRMHRLGVNLARMYAKHGDPRILWCPESTPLAQHLAAMQATCENFRGVLAMTLERMAGLEAQPEGELPPATLGQTRTLTRRVGFVPFCRGVLEELEGHDPFQVLDEGPPRGQLTSIVVVSCDALDQTRRCLAALRAAREEDHPVQFVFVDNGSSDGSAEFLAEQPDVELIRNAENLGAPRARNQGQSLCRGEFVVFMDNDVMVTPGWLGRMLYHASVDGKSGCVSCLADRAAHDQEIALPGPTDPASIAAFAARLALDKARQCRPAGLLSSFVLLVRREVLEALGGFDERFSPWGFEDDDYTLRASLAGYRNRIALDVFVRHEAYAGRAKAEAHTKLLHRNWERFAQKWGLAGEYGDYTGLDALHERTHSTESLHVSADAAAAPLQSLAV